MTVMKEELPSLSSSRLEDVLAQAASLNVSRQLGVYEIEFAVLQEEQSNTRSQVERLTQQLDQKRTEVEGLRRELAVRDLKIQNLNVLLQQSEAQLRQRENNNPRSPGQETSEDSLYRVVAAVEALSTQVTDDVRLKLEEIVSIGKQSWSRDYNFQKCHVDDCWENLLTTEEEDYQLSDDVLCEDIDIDGSSWSRKLSKLSRSP